MKIKRQAFKGIVIFGLLGAGVILGIILSISSPQLLNIFSIHKQSSSELVNTEETKKQALASFYNDLTTGEEQQEWSKDYDSLPQSVRNNVTRSEYTAYQANLVKQNKIFSQKYTVNSVQVNGDQGTVNRTLVICLTKECTGNDRKENSATKNYVYINGKWQIPDPDPSERALKAGTFIYINQSSSAQKKLVDNWGLGSTNANFAIKRYAISLDNDQSILITVETAIEKFKADQANKPKVIYQQTPVYISEPVYQQANYPTNCTSNTIGSFTHTNCY